MKVTDKNLEREFQRLVRSRNWRRLAKMRGVVNTFNIFQILDYAVCENSWSRILGALFTSNGGHDLKLRPLRTWLSLVADKRFKTLANRAAASSADCEWGTTEGRRLDVLIKLLDKFGRPIAVIGIENKVWSGEQPDQLKDYQAALRHEFPEIPKILWFLTPDKREPLTGVDGGMCPCHPCSYDTLVTMCNKLDTTANSETRLILSSLRDYIDKNIVTNGTMKTEIEHTVRNIYQNKKHQEVLDKIFEHRPTLEGVCSQIGKMAIEYFSRKKPKIKCELDQWPERSENPQEIQLWCEPLDKSGFSIYYLLRSKARRPFIGDRYTLLIAAWCKSNAARTRIKNLDVRYPERATHNFRNWDSWELLWEGETYELKDLDKQDARNLSRLLIKTISKTFQPLKLAVSKV